MSQLYNDNTKRPKLKEIQQKIQLELQQRALGPGKSAAGITYLSLRIHSKSCYMFPLKVATTLLSGSGKGAVGA